MSRWVRSKYSEEATRWEVLEEEPHAWVVLSECRCYRIILPKSEYIECPAPARWEVCTREVVDSVDPYPFKFVHGVSFADGNLRWAWDKDNPNALVIERKVEG